MSNNNKKIVSILVLLLFLFSIFSFSPAYFSPAYARKYSYSHEYKYYKYESFRPLIWAGAVYIGILGLKELIFIPEEKSMKEKELELVNLEIEKKRKEIEFLYSPPQGWKRTPRGKKFLRKLELEGYFFEE